MNKHYFGHTLYIEQKKGSGIVWYVLRLEEIDSEEGTELGNHSEECHL